MKTLALFAAALLIRLSNAAAKATAADFDELTKEADTDWSAGRYLFPSNVIAGFNADLKATTGSVVYTRETWGKYILDECLKYDECTSTISFQGTYHGSIVISQTRLAALTVT